MLSWDLVMVLVLVAAGLGSAAGAVAVHRRDVRVRTASWAGAAREAGLSAIETTGEVVSASSGPVSVRLSHYAENEASGTRVEMWSPRLSPVLSLGPEQRGLRFPFRDRKEVEVGDQKFDEEVSVQGPPALALALLDADARRTVRSMLRGRLDVPGHPLLWACGQLRAGVLYVDVPDRVPQLRGRAREDEPPPAGTVFLDGESRLPQVLRAALDLASRLLTPDDLARRIATRLPQEPEAQVRLRALLTLLREFPENAATREAVRAARNDENAALRLRAGIALGAEGRDVLLGIAGGEGAEDATSARAVSALGKTLTLDTAGELLRSALRTRRLETARACLGVLAGHGRDAVPTLAKGLLVERELGQAAAEALAATGDAAAEAPLLRALAEGTEELRRGAAAALGQVGTRDAVQPLRAAEAREPALRGVARQAVAQIHARLAGAAQGQLSLADGESGRLSLADDETGRLSLSDDEVRS